MSRQDTLGTKFLTWASPREMHSVRLRAVLVDLLVILKITEPDTKLEKSDASVLVCFAKNVDYQERVHHDAHFFTLDENGLCKAEEIALRVDQRGLKDTVFFYLGTKDLLYPSSDVEQMKRSAMSDAMEAGIDTRVMNFERLLDAARQALA